MAFIVPVEEGRDVVPDGGTVSIIGYGNAWNSRIKGAFLRSSLHKESSLLTVM